MKFANTNKLSFAILILLTNVINASNSNIATENPETGIKKPQMHMDQNQFQSKILDDLMNAKLDPQPYAIDNRDFSALSNFVAAYKTMDKEQRIKLLQELNNKLLPLTENPATSIFFQQNIDDESIIRDLQDIWIDLLSMRDSRLGYTMQCYNPGPSAHDTLYVQFNIVRPLTQSEKTNRVNGERDFAKLSIQLLIKKDKTSGYYLNITSHSNLKY